VSKVNGPGRIYLSKSSSGDNRTYNCAEDRGSVNVAMTRLDDYFCDKAQRIDVIKLDIQGAEMAAVEGMCHLLAANTDVKLFTEFWPSGLQQFGVNPRSYLTLLRELGFVLFRIDETQDALCEAIDNDLLEAYTHENNLYTNLLAVRPQCREDLPLLRSL
jgi:hypothetical protein